MPLELLYADDLILMAESEESLRDKIVKWKSGLEAKGLKMNTGKMKLMFSCSIKDYYYYYYQSTDLSDVVTQTMQGHFTE